MDCGPVYKGQVKKFSNEHRGKRTRGWRLEELDTKHKCQRPVENVAKTENAEDEKSPYNYVKNKVDRRWRDVSTISPSWEGIIYALSSSSTCQFLYQRM